MANEKRLIDANAFREFLEQIRQDYREEDTLSSGFAACLIETVQDEYLALAPTVDAVEVVHGRWLFVTKGQQTSVYVCSECNRAVTVVCDEDKIKEQLAKNCPYCHCGAKMDGDGNA